VRCRGSSKASGCTTDVVTSTRPSEIRFPFASLDDAPVTDIVRGVSEIGSPDKEVLAALGRYAGSATLILSSLADGAKHGYALTKDIEVFAGVKLAPGTLYEALARLEGQGLIEALPSTDRRRPYQLTAVGARVLRAHLTDQRRVAEVGLRRLANTERLA
jgi:DNA-binding PadR family transcriptional regulator